MAGSLRPGFVWGLAILVVPMLVLFGSGFSNDIDSPPALVVVPAYVVGAFVAPVIFVRRARRIGMPHANAIAVGLAIASVVLFADLVFVSAEGAYGATLAVGVAVGAIMFAMKWRPLAPPPPRPDLTPPRSDL